MPDKTRLMGMNIEQVRTLYNRRLEERKILAAKLEVVNTPAHKHLIKDYRLQLVEIKDQYVLIKTGEHPTKVMAALSTLQGRQKELETQLSRWTGTSGVISSLDEEIKICEDILIERGKS